MATQRKVRTATWTILKVAVVALIFVWLVNNQAIRPEYFILDQHSVPWLLLGALCILVSILLTGTRYWTILTANGIGLRLPFVLKTELAATFFNICSIGPVGGDIVRTYYVSRDSQNPLAAIGSTIADRLLGLFALLVIAAAALLAFTADFADFAILNTLKIFIFGAVELGSGILLALLIRSLAGPSKGHWACLAVASGLIIAAHVTPWTTTIYLLLVLTATSLTLASPVMFWMKENRLEHSIDQLAERDTVFGKAAKHLRALFRINVTPLGAAAALGLSLAQQSSFILAMYSFANALPLPHPPTFAETFFATPLAFIVSLLPMPGAGLGVSEAAMEYLLTRISPAIVGGASIFLCFRAWLILVSALGLPFYFSSGKHTAN